MQVNEKSIYAIALHSVITEAFNAPQDTTNAIVEIDVITQVISAACQYSHRHYTQEDTYLSNGTVQTLYEMGIL